MDMVIIIGLVMILIEIFKVTLSKFLSKETIKQLIPLGVFILAGSLNVLFNALLFEQVTIIEALRQGFIDGAIAGGIYSLGKAGLGKS